MGDTCCTNAVGDKFPCGGKGSCCGNACTGEGSKCCKVGNFTEWYPVSKDAECRSPAYTNGNVHEAIPEPVDESLLSALPSSSTSCGAAPGDLCCTNAVGDKFPCGGGGSCCGNACAGEGSKCCKVGNFTEWYPVSKDTECRSPAYTTGDVQPHQAIPEHGPLHGMNHGMFQDDFNWTDLATMSKPDCSRVCRGDHNQCYPLKNNGYMGTPCGVLSQGDPQGCFFNSPTQTCALCDTNGQGYCCPSSHIRDCPRHQ